MAEKAVEKVGELFSQCSLSVPSAGHCMVHSEEELKLYCRSCGELSCLKCSTQGGKHYNHEYQQMREAFMASQKRVKKKTATLKKSLTNLKERSDKMSKRQEAVESSIHATFQKLRDAIDARETQLVGQLHQITEKKLKDLTVQKMQVETTLEKLVMYRGTKETQSEKVMIDTILKEKALRCYPALKADTDADIVVFSATLDHSFCQTYGLVEAPGILDPSACFLTEEVAVAGVEEMATVTLQSINCGGRPCEEVISQLECELVSEITGATTTCDVQRKGQSSYEISYQPTVKGMHQLHIKAEGHHIRGSPFSTAVRSKVENLGTPIWTYTMREKPLNVAINQRREVIVVGELGTVSSPPTLRYNIRGSNPIPCAVAVDGEGDVFVSDIRNNCIQKFTATGKLIATVGTEGSGPLQFFSPTGITVSDNKVYVMDGGNNRVQVLAPDLSYQYMIETGTRSGEAGNWYLACDGAGMVYVADTIGHCIRVFNSVGGYVRKFGQHGKDPGELDTPGGVAIDGDTIYISENSNNRISVFTLKGRYVTSFGRKGSGPGEFSRPNGLAVDNCGVVYVCDSGNSRLQVF